jgi:hypothetical protein
MKHRISQARSGMVLLIVLAVWIGVMIATAKLVDGRFIEAASTAWSAGFVGIIFLHRKLAARLCRLRAITSGDIVVFPLELYLKAAKEEEEFEYEAAAELVEVQAAMAANTKDWICSHCREENPANFLDCWNCKTTRTET